MCEYACMSTASEDNANANANVTACVAKAGGNRTQCHYKHQRQRTAFVECTCIKAILKMELCVCSNLILEKRNNNLSAMLKKNEIFRFHPVMIAVVLSLYINRFPDL